MDHTLKPDIPSNEIIDTNPKFNSKFVDANFNPLPSSVCSPINVPVFTSMLQTHPNCTFVKFLLDSFTFGFQIGYTGPMTPGQRNNLLSARTHPPVTAALIKELNRGHTSGPFLQSSFAQLHCSPLGAVPKKDGTYRIILDLSSPRGSSINEWIDPSLYSVRYSSFDNAVKLVADLGSNAYMAKLDIKHAFRLCPVCPSDWPLLGYC